MEKTTITKVKFKGYKSIIDLEIDLKSDINILIGKNGAGKTNFLSFLNMTLRRHYNDIEPDFSSIVEFNDGEKYHQLYARMNKKDIWDDMLNSNKNNQFYFERKIFDNENNLKDEFQGNVNEIDQEIIGTYSVMIKHGITNGHLYLLEYPFHFSIKNNFSSEINKIIRDGKKPLFLHFLFSFYKAYYSYYDQNTKAEQVKNDVVEFFNQNIRNNLYNNLKSFTIIEDIRINKDISVNKIEDNNFKISNVFFEFFVNNKWFPFSNLSDGLKRIFIIIAEISFDKIVIDNKLTKSDYVNPTYLNYPFNNKIILLEEPELGIHPHQLFQLMTFLKESSKDKQIIISTHSPEILDHLDKDELDRIIICEFNKNKGSILKHLSDKDIEKAKKYMQELDLSDYWKHTNNF